MSILVPAVLPTSREDLEEKIALFATFPGVSRVQIDTVDGKFIAPASWPYTDSVGWRAMRAEGGHLPSLDRFQYEIDLMNFDAERAGDEWLALGATRLTFHAESATDLPLLLARTHARHGTERGFAPGLLSLGIALNLASDLALIEPALAHADFVQFMGIARIGRQHEPFDRRVFERIRAFRRRHPDIPMQVDGGVSLEHARELLALGVSNVIVGSAILRAPDPRAAAAAFAELSTRHP